MVDLDWWQRTSAEDVCKVISEDFDLIYQLEQRYRMLGTAWHKIDKTIRDRDFTDIPNLYNARCLSSRGAWRLNASPANLFDEAAQDLCAAREELYRNGKTEEAWEYFVKAHGSIQAGENELQSVQEVINEVRECEQLIFDGSEDVHRDYFGEQQQLETWLITLPEVYHRVTQHGESFPEIIAEMENGPVRLRY